ncbi:MAG TPA: hypothetical protein VMJ72_01950 [Candidatus Paceibacterota bacterium]|nr:hypothetical protein [Candidatus Paceibacterota bacterium]
MTNVAFIATHYEPHPDEALAIWMAVRFGEKMFPGVTEAYRKGQVLFCDAGRELPIKLPCKRKNIMEIGIGGGEFDEHRDGQTGDECAATLMADRLGLRGDPALEKMLDWALRNDQDAEGTAFDWSDIMKAAFHAGIPARTMLKRSLRIFDAVYNTLSGKTKYTDISGMRSYWQLAADWVLDFAPYKPTADFSRQVSGPLMAAKAMDLTRDERIYWIINYEINVFGDAGKPPRTPGFMEIPSIVESLYHDGASVGEVTYFVREMLNARLAEQKLFNDATDEWNAVLDAQRNHEKTPNGSTFELEEWDVTYKVAVVVSDNRRILSAIRNSHTRPHVIVRAQPSTGHISLFGNGLDVTPVVKRLRAACWEAVGNTSILTPERLAHEWTIAEVPQLCFQKKAGNILNGSLTAPHVEPVRIGLKTYLSVVKYGLREVARAAVLNRKAAKRRSRERRDARIQKGPVQGEAGALAIIADVLPLE